MFLNFGDEKQNEMLTEAGEGALKEILSRPSKEQRIKNTETFVTVVKVIGVVFVLGIISAAVEGYKKEKRQKNKE